MEIFRRHVEYYFIVQQFLLLMFSLGKFLAFQSSQFIWHYCFPFYENYSFLGFAQRRFETLTPKSQTRGNLGFASPGLLEFADLPLPHNSVPFSSCLPSQFISSRCAHTPPCTHACAYVCIHTLTHSSGSVFIGERGWAAGRSGLNLSCLGDRGQ